MPMLQSPGQDQCILQYYSHWMRYSAAAETYIFTVTLMSASAAQDQERSSTFKKKSPVELPGLFFLGKIYLVSLSVKEAEFKEVIGKASSHLDAYLVFFVDFAY